MAGDHGPEYTYDLTFGQKGAPSFLKHVRRHQMVLGWFGLIGAGIFLTRGKKEQPAPKK